MTRSWRFENSLIWKSARTNAFQRKQSVVNALFPTVRRSCTYRPRFLILKRVIHLFPSQPGQIITVCLCFQSATKAVILRVQGFYNTILKKKVPGWLPVTFVWEATETFLWNKKIVKRYTLQHPKQVDYKLPESDPPLTYPLLESFIWSRQLVSFP